MKPPARAIVGNLIWSGDGGGVWALWRVAPFSQTHSSMVDKLAVHSRIHGLLVGLPAESMLLSVCERVEPGDVVARMADGVDLRRSPAWAAVCDATHDWLGQVPLRRRLYYLAVQLPGPRRSLRETLREVSSDLSAFVGFGPAPIPRDDVDLRRRQARELEARLLQYGALRPASPGEICWLYARALRRGPYEPSWDEQWEPPAPGRPGGGNGKGKGGGGLAGLRNEEAERWRPRGVLAHLADAVVKEGGHDDDVDRPRHRRYVRIDDEHGTSYQTVLAMSDMPHYFRFPDGGEWFHQVDSFDFPVDWCVRVRSMPNPDAQVKVRRKHRDLIGQIDEYDGELTGAPPQLAAAIQAIDEERTRLGANPAEPEMQVTVLFSIAAAGLADLEGNAGTLVAAFQPQEYGLARPTGGQVALLRSMLPGTAAGPVSRDYTQFMLARDLAAGSPYCGSEVGDPQGLLLGVSLDTGIGTPVLFDPAFGPRANASPSLAAVGRLGSGKSFFLKRLCWDTVARGGQVVTIDRTRSGEYVRFAEAVAGRVQVVRLEAGADVRLDPLRSFTGDERTTVTLGFLSLLAGCSAHSEDGAALAEAVDHVVARPHAVLADVVDELDRMGEDLQRPDPAARGLARRLAHYRRAAMGQLAFGEGSPLSLDADFIVFWAPNLALPDRKTLESTDSASLMLPEQVLGQALLYLVAAVGRQVVFRDPSRFAAALYDEAWAILASPHGQSLLIEGVRDGRKHNGAIWLASQHPNDFAVSELEDLLGSRFVFRQARQAVPAALRFLGMEDSAGAVATLQGGLQTGECLYRDVRDRVGLIRVLPPALDHVEAALDTAPPAAGDDGGAGDDDIEDAEVVEEDEPADELDVVRDVELAALAPAAPAPAVMDALPPSPPPPPALPAASLEDAAAARRRVREKRRTPLAQALADRSDP